MQIKQVCAFNSQINLDRAEEHAKKIMWTFLNGAKDLNFVKQKIISNGKTMKRLQEKTKQYFLIKRAQQDLIFDILMREKKRIIVCLVRDETVMQTIIPVLSKVTDKHFMDLISKYYQYCSHVHNVAFAEWRKKTKQLKDEGFVDVNDGYYYPYLKIRTVQTLASINFRPDWLETPLIKFQVKLTHMLGKKYQYLMMTNTEESEAEEEGNFEFQKPQTGTQKQRRRKTKPSKNSSAQESKQGSQMLKQVAFPERPALKFIPSPEVSHQLLLQAVFDFDSVFCEAFNAKILADPSLFETRKRRKAKVNSDSEQQQPDTSR